MKVSNGKSRTEEPQRIQSTQPKSRSCTLVPFQGESVMVDLSIQIEGVTGLTWQRWKRLVSEVESLGFAGLYCCDHFSFPFTLGMPSLEMILALTYAADHSQRLRFGSLVAPLSIRDPVM